MGSSLLIGIVACQNTVSVKGADRFGPVRSSIWVTRDNGRDILVLSNRKDLCEEAKARHEAQVKLDSVNWTGDCSAVSRACSDVILSNEALLSDGSHYLYIDLVIEQETVHLTPPIKVQESGANLMYYVTDTWDEGGADMDGETCICETVDPPDNYREEWGELNPDLELLNVEPGEYVEAELEGSFKRLRKGGPGPVEISAKITAERCKMDDDVSPVPYPF